MFTGIIEEIGCLKAKRMNEQDAIFDIAATKVLADMNRGDSIAIDGVCLTVVDFGPFSFEVEASSETLRRTTLGRLKVGSPLNLERALRLDQRLGGHLVSGHIDGLGVIHMIRREGRSQVLHVYAAEEILAYVVPKGSIAIDGISLTINFVDTKGFSVNLIPHTLDTTAISRKKAGDGVNLEADMLGKYIEKLMRDRLAGDNKEGRGGMKVPGIDEDLLRRTGFLSS